jgi:predicted aspartyl protease
MAQVLLRDETVNQIATAFHLSSMKVPAFSGLTDNDKRPDISEWIECYEEYCKANGWPDVIKCRMLPVYLTHTAIEFFRQEIRDTAAENDWQQIKTKLKDNFQAVDHFDQAMTALVTRTQRPAEPVNNFILDMRRKARVVDPNMPFLQVRYWIMNGIEKEYKSRLKEQDHQDLDTFTTAARWLEASREADNDTGRDLAVTTTSDNLTVSVTEKVTGWIDGISLSKHCMYCNITGHTTNACRERQKEENGSRKSERKKHKFKSITSGSESTSAYQSVSSCDSSVTKWPIRAIQYKDSSARKRHVHGSERNGHGTASWSSSSRASESLFILKEENEICPVTLTVTMGGIRFDAFVDTGASSTFIEEDVSKALTAESKQNCTPAPDVTTANGKLLEGAIAGATVNICVKIDGREKQIPSSVIVCKQLPYPVILGRDFLHKADLVIHAGTGNVFFAYDGRCDVKSESSDLSGEEALTMFKQMVKKDNVIKVHVPDGALAAFHGNTIAIELPDSQQERAVRQKKEVKTCHYCGRPGHLKSVCLEREKNKDERKWKQDSASRSHDLSMAGRGKFFLMVSEDHEEVKSLFAHVLIENMALRGVIDTGVSATFIHADVFKQLKADTRAKLSCYPGIVRTADNSEMGGIMGLLCLEILIRIHGDIRHVRTIVVVSDQLPHEVIPGRVFQHEAQLMIDAAEQKISYKDTRVHAMMERGSTAGAFVAHQEGEVQATGQEQDYGIIRVAVHKDILREAANRTVELTIPADCLDAVRIDAGFEKRSDGRSLPSDGNGEVTRIRSVVKRGPAHNKHQNTNDANDTSGSWHERCWSCGCTGHKKADCGHLKPGVTQTSGRRSARNRSNNSKNH